MALASVWLLSALGVRISTTRIVLIVLAVGTFFEVFEYIFNIGGSNFMSYQADTAKDIVNDVLGGIFGIIVLRGLQRRLSGSGIPR